MAIDERFVYLDEAAPGIAWDSKYYGSDNLTGAPLDGYFTNRIVGARELGVALNAAREYFSRRGYGLLVYDAYRPVRAVRAFARWAAAPEDMRTKAAHYPRHDKTELFALGYIAEKSGHSRGGSMDLTLTRNGFAIGMGGTFDFMDDISHHSYPVPEPARANRRLLREGMEKCGFAAYDGEWWHYNLINEPYPDTYFDFPVSAPDFRCFE